jgi:hypothetical protein
MKKCKSEGCNYDCFSHGFCKRHQHERTDDKALKLKNVVSKQTVIKRTPIKVKYRAPTGQLEAFKEIWACRPHVSEITGDKILMFDIKCFHHILTKQAYPKFLLFKPNIILLTRNEHRMVHDHSIEDLIKKDSRWEKLKMEYQILKGIYNNGEEVL